MNACGTRTASGFASPLISLFRVHPSFVSFRASRVPTSLVVQIPPPLLTTLPSLHIVLPSYRG